MQGGLNALGGRCALALCALLGAPSPAWAGVQAERAVAAVAQLRVAGDIPAGTTLTLTVKQGNLASFVGANGALKAAWVAQTGVPVDVKVMPQLDSQAFIRADPDVDLTIARTHEYADLVDAGLIEDLTPWFSRFGFTRVDDPAAGFMLAPQQTRFGDAVVAIPADGDVAVLYLRADLLDDPVHRQRFAARFGRPLAVPETWAEYTDLVTYFHRPADGFYGALEPREPLTGWMYWMLRYASRGRPNQWLFDDAMRPLIDSPAGIAATRDYLATVAASPPDILAAGNDYSYTLPLFLQGKGFATIITLAAAKLINQPHSPVRGKAIAVPMPGNRIGGTLVRRGALIYGNNLVVPRRAPNKALAFLFAMWLTDPDNSRHSVGVRGGFADPYRLTHFDDPRIREVYSPAMLDVVREGLPETVPAGIGVPGDAAYLAALSTQLWQAAAGKISAAQAMRRTAQAWETITESHGRESQIAHWRRHRRLYPGAMETAR